MGEGGELGQGGYKGEDSYTVEGGQRERLDGKERQYRGG